MKTFLLCSLWAILPLCISPASQGAAADANFALTLAPAEATLIPGKSAGFLVSVSPLQGFDQPVLLAVAALPAGVSAEFSSNPVTPPGSSVVTLRAAADALLGPFRLDLVAIGGGVTNRTSLGVTVNFGLLPLCHGSVHGAVTDSETGVPVAGAKLFISDQSATSDDVGRFSISQLRLGEDNLPQAYSMQAIHDGYWPTYTDTFHVVCGAAVEINVPLVRKAAATISGTVTDTFGNPLASVEVRLGANIFPSDAAGKFQAGPVEVGHNNTSIVVQVSGHKQGYWDAQVSATIYAGSNTVPDLVLVPICGPITVSGKLVYIDNQLPATGIPVILRGQHQSGSATTDAEGNYSFPGQTLNAGNTPAPVRVTAGAPGYYFDGPEGILTDCAGVAFSMPPFFLTPVTPPPEDNFAGLTGHVFDLETGAPIAGASISGVENATWTDEQGRYNYASVNLRSFSSNLFTLYVSRDQYETTATKTWLVSGQVSTQDIRLLPLQYGYLTGTVRDSASRLPLAGAEFSSFRVWSDQVGRYRTEPLTLAQGNQAQTHSSAVVLNGYWPVFLSTRVAKGTNVVDIDLVKICTGANISGTVVNAVSQAPIAAATVFARGQSVQTDANGQFAFRNLRVGHDNSPSETQIYATAPGFNPQSKYVTIFCGANIVTEFGRPQTVFGAVEGYVTNVLTGLPLTNVFIGSQFGAAAQTDTDGYYQFPQVPLGLDGANTSWEISAVPTGLAAQIKPVLVSSNQTSRLDFGFGAANTDLAVAAEPMPEPALVDAEFTHTFVVTNKGGDAEHVVLQDHLPPALTFVRASVMGDGFTAPVFADGTVTSSATTFRANASVILRIVLKSASAGVFTHSLTAATETPDTDPSNDRASAQVTVTAATTGGGEGEEGLEAGPLHFNPQTGLFEQAITVTPRADRSAEGVQLSITGIAPGRVYNASGVTNGTAFVQLAGPLPGAAVRFLVEYYLPDRQTNRFNPRFTIVAVNRRAAASAVGQSLTLNRDVHLIGGRSLIEFSATPGRSYTVQYSLDTETWQSVTPSVTAAGTRVQWFDDGPPKTASKPSQLGSRFYRVLLLP